MDTRKIKGFKNYYITKDGSLFRIYGGKELKVPIKIKRSTPLVKIGNSSYNFIFLMIEYFGNNIIPITEMAQYKFQYKFIDGKINFDSIKIKKFKSSFHSDVRMFQYKCLEKANSANSRVYNVSTICESDVFDSLLRTDFKCSYCDRKLDYKTWELDHIAPLSGSGSNSPTNITPSCKMCNRMKSNMELLNFVHTCAKIALNFKDTDLLNEVTFSLPCEDKNTQKINHG